MPCNQRNAEQIYVMRKSTFGLLAYVVIGCAGSTGVAADDDLDQRYASIVTEACIERGRLGTSPEMLTQNCRCVADVMSRYVRVEMKTQTVQRGQFDDSEWARIKSTSAASKINESLYHDCALSYALIQQWP